MCENSVVVVLRNFLRAGVLKNRSSTSICVPGAAAASSDFVRAPPVIRSRIPTGSVREAVTMALEGDGHRVD